VEDGGVLLVECDGRHGGVERVDGEGGMEGEGWVTWIFKRKRQNVSDKK
jgi:hypothetical protein